MPWMDAEDRRIGSASYSSALREKSASDWTEERQPDLVSCGIGSLSCSEYPLGTPSRSPDCSSSSNLGVSPINSLIVCCSIGIDKLFDAIKCVSPFCSGHLH